MHPILLQVSKTSKNKEIKTGKNFKKTKRPMTLKQEYEDITNNLMNFFKFQILWNKFKKRNLIEHRGNKDAIITIKEIPSGKRSLEGSQLRQEDCVNQAVEKWNKIYSGRKQKSLERYFIVSVISMIGKTKKDSSDTPNLQKCILFITINIKYTHSLFSPTSIQFHRLDVSLFKHSLDLSNGLIPLGSLSITVFIKNPCFHPSTSVRPHQSLFGNFSYYSGPKDLNL